MPNAISVIILTLNEEKNLPGAFASLDGHTDDVIVFDSGSTDSTCAIAEAFGARVIFREFDNYAAQRNAALGTDLKHDWVLMLDADERVPPELWMEMERAIFDRGATALFRMRRRDYFLGRWLKRSSGYPTWFGRLMRRGQVSIRRDINEEYVTEGTVYHLQEHLDHFPFNRGVEHWMDRHNKYTTAEARHLAAAKLAPWVLWEITSADPVIRRRCAKRIAMKLPGRPLLTFLYLFVFRLGVLDGMPGYYYCRMRAFYELLIDVKAVELRNSSAEATTT